VGKPHRILGLEQEGLHRVRPHRGARADSSSTAN